MRLNAEFQGFLDEGAGLIFGQSPAVIAALGIAITHAAKAYARDVETRAAKFDVFHFVPFNRTKPPRAAAPIWVADICADPGRELISK
jgi:hypothetical protein